jgi:drug/metabolite transporter (DMT)-like permease
LTRREQILAYGALIVVCVLWGTTYLAIRVAVRTIPDAWMSAFRFIIAGSILAAILKLRGEKFPPVSEWKHIAFVGICLVGLGNWLLVWAEKTVPSGPAALMLAVLPFYMIFLDPFSRRLARNSEPSDKHGIKMYIGLILGFGGVALLVLPELQQHWSGSYSKGVIVLQFACVAWTIGSLYSKYKPVQCSPLVNASLQMIFGGIFLLFLAWFKGDFSRVVFRTDTLLAFLYLIIFGAMIGYAAYAYALNKLPASVVSIYAYVNPVIAVWLGWLILHEQVTILTIMATAIILFGVWLVRGQNAKKTPASGIEKDAA